ncbi:MAG: homoserine O-succinyltransferase [Pseudomonadota bacterium]
MTSDGAARGSLIGERRSLRVLEGWKRTSSVTAHFANSRPDQVAGDAEAARRWRDVTAPTPEGFVLESGERLSRSALNVRLYGDPAKPLVIAMGGISSGRFVAAAVSEESSGPGWWGEIVKAGGAVDLEVYSVLGVDFLPNTEETARTISTHDQARAIAGALDCLGVRDVHALVGASYGGMVALAFAALFPARTGKLCIISAAERAHPAATALRGIQRRIVEFAERHGDGQEGVSLARQIAMTTYRTAEEFGARFDGDVAAAAGEPYAVCDYLVSRGNSFAMGPSRYLTLSDSIDRHRVDPALVETPSLLIAASSDRLVEPAEMRRLADAINANDQDAAATLHEFHSDYGHDAFLKDIGVIGPLIKAFIEEKTP